MIEPSGAGEVTGGGAAGDLEGLFDEAGGEAGDGKLLPAGDELGGKRRGATSLPALSMGVLMRRK